MTYRVGNSLSNITGCFSSENHWLHSCTQRDVSAVSLFPRKQMIATVTALCLGFFIAPTSSVIKWMHKKWFEDTHMVSNMQEALSNTILVIITAEVYGAFLWHWGWLKISFSHYITIANSLPFYPFLHIKKGQYHQGPKDSGLWNLVFETNAESKVFKSYSKTSIACLYK